MESFRAIAAGVALLIWILLAIAWLLRRTPHRGKQLAQDQKSLLGLGLQCIGYLSVWTWRRRGFSPLVPLPQGLDIFLSCLAIGLTLGSATLVVLAVRALGRHFRLTAQFLEGHHLVTSGPYRFVRHPIYAAMLLLLFGTGIAWSTKPALLAALLFYAAGTWIRIQAEEQLLCKGFGREYEAYARCVPAFLPRLW